MDERNSLEVPRTSLQKSQKSDQGSFEEGNVSCQKKLLHHLLANEIAQTWSYMKPTSKTLEVKRLFCSKFAHRWATELPWLHAMSERWMLRMVFLMRQLLWPQWVLWWMHVMSRNVLFTPWIFLLDRQILQKYVRTMVTHVKQLMCSPTQRIMIFWLQLDSTIFWAVFWKWFLGSTQHMIWPTRIYLYFLSFFFFSSQTFAWVLVLKTFSWGWVWSPVVGATVWALRIYV